MSATRCFHRRTAASLSSRFLSSVTTEPSSPSAAYVEKQGQRVVICSESSPDVELNASWLWSNDAKWVHETSAQRLKTPAEYDGSLIKYARLVPSSDENVTPQPPAGSCHPIGGFSLNGNSAETDWVLEVEWQNREDPSHYHVPWIMEWMLPKAQSTEVTTQHALSAGDELSKVDYNAVQSTESGRFNLLTALFSKGAVLVTNCPAPSATDSEFPVGTVGKLLAGGLSHGSLYGDIFHVESIPQAHNLAYTTVGLTPHQDLAYYESPPGIQLIHCVKNRGVTGGESILVDAMGAAHEFCRIAPDLYEILTSTEATFCKQRKDADMVAFIPHIVTSPATREIVGINWSPPFEGPLRYTDKAEEYYAAYAAFARMVDKSLPENHHALSPELCRTLKEYAQEHTFETMLQEGDMLIFNNQRMLHGRNSFDYTEANGARHLVGCYTNIDETLNRYRVLMRKFGWEEEMLNVGNGSSSQ